MFSWLKILIPGRGMLAFRYRGTTIRTSAFKLMFLGIFTISMVMFMRLQGLFVAMPPMEDKHPLGRTFSRHSHDDWRRNIIHRTPDILVQQNMWSLFTSQRQRQRITTESPSTETRPTTSEFVLPSLDLNMNEAAVGVEKLREFVRELNSKGEIRNLDKFPEPMDARSMVIVVQVHNRPDYFSYLLRSLRRAKGIENSLLVISHDYYNEYINKLVDAIDFCKVLQIFFPYSMQLYPNQFPGTDPGDCPRDINKDRAKEVNCINADHPDKYGHFREAKFTMTKHHWWWKANTVFDGLNITRNYDGPVLFLEEDHYAAPDFYHVLRLMYETKRKDSICGSGCDILTLGTYAVSTDYKAVGENAAQIIPWKSVRHNMGMAFDRSTWNSIKSCKELFCTYDDYNWDWTLMKISTACLKKPLRALVMKAARMFHIGECGIHHKKKKCQPAEQAVGRFNDIIDHNDKSLYPSSLAIEQKYTDPARNGQPNGGWGDSRDHALCLTFDYGT